jgi:hypothetical protein
MLHDFQSTGFSGIEAASFEVLRPATGVVATTGDDGLVILDTRQGLVFESCPVGAYVWKRIAGGASTRRLAAEVADRFGIPVDSAARDLNDFVTGLLSCALVVPQQE